eukprot:m.846755 g.846755  ORF g.846755 m.846755 type:complete len:194 (-) comp23477_c1_seq125:3308-3889(-)
MHEAMKCAANESRINPQVNPRMVAPNQSDPDVIVIPAGEPVPTWIQPNKTLVFGPGEHRLQPSLVPKGKWPVYTLPSQVYVYIPVDAILYFAMVGRADETISIGGYGHLSGEEMPRCHFPYDDQRSRSSTDPANTTCDNNSPQGLTLVNVAAASVTGITFIDFPNHHMILGTNGNAKANCLYSTISNVKVSYT